MTSIQPQNGDKNEYEPLNDLINAISDSNDKSPANAEIMKDEILGDVRYGDE